ncbi:MAG: glutamate racemase [Treponemataceae bacterium]
MMKKNTIQPIDFAFLDSGTGGIPYMQFLVDRQPHIRCVYIADTQNFPYGEKTSEQIINCAISISRTIIEHFNPKVIIIACNTISGTALPRLRETFTTPFIGTVPAIKLAEKLSTKKRIGLLATKRTIAENYTQKLIADYASNCVVVKKADSQLISFIEHNLFTATTAEKKEACKKSVDFFIAQMVDIIILGCTHFIHFSSIIQQLCGNAIQVIDSREGVISQALRVIEKRPAAQQKTTAIFQNELYVTDMQNLQDQHKYQELCKQLHIDFKGII